MGPNLFLRIAARHLALGIPLAAGLHTAVQTLADPGEGGLGLTLLHFGLGSVFGSFVLAPAYLAQALLVWTLVRGGRGRLLAIVAGATLQATLVILWAAAIGIEPSLSGRFPMTVPMIAAAMFAGALVATLGVPRAAQRA